MSSAVTVVLSFFSAIVVALGLIILPRVSAGVFSSAIVVPAFFFWWVIADRRVIPWWWVLLLLVLIDALTITPRGALVFAFAIAVIVLLAMDRLLPLHRLSLALVSVILAAAAFVLTLSSTIFLFTASSGAVIPWKSTLLQLLIVCVLTSFGVIALWPYRHRSGFLL